jgi:hypothetical protein
MIHFQAKLVSDPSGHERHGVSVRPTRPKHSAYACAYLCKRIWADSEFVLRHVHCYVHPISAKKQVGRESANAPLKQSKTHANASILGGWVHNTTTHKMKMLYGIKCCYICPMLLNFSVKSVNQCVGQVTMRRSDHHQHGLSMEEVEEKRKEKAT